MASTAIHLMIDRKQRLEYKIQTKGHILRDLLPPTRSHPLLLPEIPKVALSFGKKALTTRALGVGWTLTSAVIWPIGCTCCVDKVYIPFSFQPRNRTQHVTNIQAFLDVASTLAYLLGCLMVVGGSEIPTSFHIVVTHVLQLILRGVSGPTSKEDESKGPAPRGLQLKSCHSSVTEPPYFLILLMKTERVHDMGVLGLGLKMQLCWWLVVTGDTKESVANLCCLILIFQRSQKGSGQAPRFRVKTVSIHPVSRVC